MLDKIFPVLYLSSLFNFCYIWFFAKDERICKSILRISVMMFLPSVLQSYYSFYQEGPGFNSTILIVVEYLLHLLVTSFAISLTVMIFTGVLDSMVNKRLKERKAKKASHITEDTHKD